MSWRVELPDNIDRLSDLRESISDNILSRLSTEEAVRTSPDNIDRLSDLPAIILDNILSRLSIEEAVRTSVLSSKWRYRWVDISDIVFDHGVYYGKQALAKAVYYILISHRGQINKFELFSRHEIDVEDLDSWISFLSKNGIKELILGLHSEYYQVICELPPSLSACQGLRQLSVSNCTANEINGLRNLTSLELKSFKSMEDMFLISGCPNLEKLVISHCNIRKCMKIDAPKLNSLYVHGDFEDIHVTGSPLLNDVSLNLSSPSMAEEISVPNLGSFSQFEKLSLCHHFLKHWAARVIHHEQVTPLCGKLKVLELSEVHLGELDEIFFVVSLLSNSPNLKEFSISVHEDFNEHSYEFMPSQSQFEFPLNQLQVVRMEIINEGYPSNYFGTALALLKLVLSSSPLLESLDVKYNNGWANDIWFMRELLSFKRASTKLLLRYNTAWWRQKRERSVDFQCMRKKAREISGIFLGSFTLEQYCDFLGLCAHLYDNTF